MYLPTVEEAMFEELEMAYAMLEQDINANDPEAVIEQAERIMSSANILGICKDDGKVLESLGLITNDLTERLTEYRSPVGLDEVGIEIDKENLLGKIALIAIGALTSLLSYIVYKLFKIVRDFFGSGKLPEDGGLSKVTPERLAKFKKVADVFSEKLDSHIVKAVDDLNGTKLSNIIPKDKVDKYAYLNFPKWALDTKWASDAIGVIKTAAEGIEKTTNTEDVDEKAKAEDMVKALKENARPELGGLESFFSSKLESMFTTPSVPSKYTHYNSQLKFIATWADGDKYVAKDINDKVLDGDVKSALVLSKDALDEGEKKGEAASAELEGLTKSIKKMKVKGRGGSGVANTYLELSATKPINCCKALTSNLIIPYYSSLAKLSLNLNGAMERADKVLAAIGDWVGKQRSDKSVKISPDDLGKEFNRYYTEGNKLPTDLHPFEAVAKDAKSYRGISDLYQAIVISIISGGK